MYTRSKLPPHAFPHLADLPHTQIKQCVLYICTCTFNNATPLIPSIYMAYAHFDLIPVQTNNLKQRVTPACKRSDCIDLGLQKSTEILANTMLLCYYYVSLV